MVKVVALLIGFTLAVSAQPRRERVFLGEANVDGAADHITRFNSGVESSAVKFDRVIVHFGNGRSEPIHIRQHINVFRFSLEMRGSGGRLHRPVQQRPPEQHGWLHQAKEHAHGASAGDPRR